MAENITAMEKASSWQTNKARKVDSRVEYGRLFRNHLYGGMDEPDLKIIDVFICKLRKKLTATNGGDKYIRTVWGQGYVLRDPVEQARTTSAEAAALTVAS